jgi:hypothetical protein
VGRFQAVCLKCNSGFAGEERRGFVTSHEGISGDRGFAGDDEGRREGCSAGVCFVEVPAVGDADEFDVRCSL